MNKNESNIDRILRVVVGLALMAYAFFMPDAPLALFAWIGIVPFVTGLIGWCPLYSIFGIKTCKTE